MVDGVHEFAPGIFPEFAPLVQADQILAGESRFGVSA